MTEQIEEWVNGPRLTRVVEVNQPFTTIEGVPGLLISLELWAREVRLLSVIPFVDPAGISAYEANTYTLADDQGTVYEDSPTGGGGGGDGTRMWCFQTWAAPVPPEARRLTITNRRSGQVHEVSL